jgi:hypothetical protein
MTVDDVLAEASESLDDSDMGGDGIRSAMVCWPGSLLGCVIII